MNGREGRNLLDFLAAGINRNDPVIQAVFSNDEGEGALANEIEDVAAFIDYYSRTPDIRGHNGNSLEMIAKLFVRAKRQAMETDARLLRRTLSLTERKGDRVWGNALDMKHIFETYFERIRAFISENTNAMDKNLLGNGDFEEDDQWNLSGSARYTYGARFSGQRGLYFDGGAAAASQTIRNVPAGLYAFHFFLSGKCGVTIMRDSGVFWNGTARANNYVLSWHAEPFINGFASPDWNDVFCFVRLDEGVEELTVEFTPVAGEAAMIDYVRLFEKPDNPSYTITLQFEGYTLANKTFHLGAGQNDPAPEVEVTHKV
jgi:hypothetical protein